MNIKDLGLEELTVSEKRETKGGLAPIVYAGIAVAMWLIPTIASAPGTGGGGWNGGPVP